MLYNIPHLCYPLQPHPGVRLRGGGSEQCFGDEVYPVFVIGTPKSKDSVVPVFVIEIPVLQCHVGGDASRGAMISCDVIWFCDAGTRNLLHAHLLMVIIILTNILEAMLTQIFGHPYQSTLILIANALQAYLPKVTKTGVSEVRLFSSSPPRWGTLRLSPPAHTPARHLSCTCRHRQSGGGTSA